MSQYIDKDILLKAIEIKRNGLIALMNQIYYASNYPIWSSNVALLDEVKRGIDILEVKKVDLEKELSLEDYNSFFKKYPDFPDNWGFDEAWIFAKYFFELGLKAAQK